MTEPNYDTLLNELSDLRDDAPPMPEDLHAAWMRRVEETPMNENTTPIKVRRLPRGLTQFLAAAAALVFLIGGTAITKDALSPAEKASVSREAPMYKTMASNDTSFQADRTMLAASGNSAEAPAVDYAYEEDAVMLTADTEAAGVEQPSKIIRSASLGLNTTDFDTAYDDLRARCTQMGGWISYTSTNTNRSGLRTAWLTLRIPADQLDAFLSTTGDVGRVVSSSESADDVTASYYDTAGRLASKQALLDRLLSLATDAADLADLLSLESKIAEVQLDIDRLRGNLNHTDSQVSFATVDITLAEEADADAMQVREKTLLERMVSAITVGWQGLISFLGDMLVFLVAALPALIVLAAVIVIVHIVREKKRAAKK